MKYFLLATLFITACGPVDNLCEHNRDSLGIACSDVFGYDYEQKDLNKSLGNSVEEINKRLLALEEQNQTLIQQGNAYSNQISFSQNRIEELQNQINGLDSKHTQDILQLQSTINMLTNMVDQNQNDIQYLESLINMNTINILNLQQTFGNSIEINEMLDACGNDSNEIDEIFLRMSNGKIVASFSNNGSALTTRLSIIEPSDTQVYTTTDQTSCSFKVFATGPKANKVCWGTGFNTCI